MSWLPDEGWMIVCAVMLVAVLFNVGLIYSFMNPATRRYLSEMRAGLQFRGPWEREAESLQELHDAVEALDERESPSDE